MRCKDPAKMLIYFRRITENETEVSFFNREAYEAFKAHPEVSSSASPVIQQVLSTILD